MLIYKELTSRIPSSDLASPIYDGKAVPSGSRKGGTDFDSAIGHALYTRLKNHAESIRESENLELQDFQCRYLIVDDVWIPLAESLLIAKFQPPWNVVLDGFGNNAQGRGRIDQKISSWDVIHPGRKRVVPLKPSAKSRDEIEARIAAHFKGIR